MSKPDALALADQLEFAGRYGSETEQAAAQRRVARNNQAAAELRRLHAVNEALRFALSRIAGRCDAQAAYKIAIEALGGQE